MSRFLNELEGARLLQSAGLPVTESRVVHSPDEAARQGAALGFPVVMKILSADILHKTDAGCVVLGVSDGDAARRVYQDIVRNAEKYDAGARIDGVVVQQTARRGLEVILGVKKDPQFGPVLMVGTGGIYVEVFGDVALRLAPITWADAEQMLDETRLSAIIGGARGVEYDRETLIELLLRLSRLVQSHPDVEEIDVNPLFLYEKGQGARAVDALVRVK